MANGVVDRGEWAQVVRELLDAETEIRKHGAKTRLAAKIRITTRTLDTWLAEDVDVKESSVRQVAEACGLDAMELLIRVGYYSLDQMPRITHEQMDAERLAVINNPTLDDGQKAYILQALDEMEAADERLIEQQRERDRQRRAERVATLMEQKHHRAA